MMNASIAATRFDFILEPQLFSSSRLEDTFVAETQSFAVVPSLGSLVPGWLLVVPKRRVLNCGMLSESERLELKGLIGHLTEALRRFPGNVFAFEHGPAHIASLAGCGVDQAHMHLVPLEFDLLAVASNAAGVHWNVDACASIADLVHRNGEYVAINDHARGRSIVGCPVEQTSQWVRKVIATELDRTDEWDYRESPQRDIIAATVRELMLPPSLRV